MTTYEHHIQKWVEKRQFFDHMQKLFDSGLPISAHSIHGWADQYDRMVRFKERATNSRNELAKLDFSIAFFQSCYHLRDWIPKFEKITKRRWNQIWADFVKQHKSLLYCRDICNGTKHLVIDNPSIDKDFAIIRDYENIPGSNRTKFIGWYLYAGGKRIYLDDLMESCLRDWNLLIKQGINANWQ
jgi:hypothetical protein